MGEGGLCVRWDGGVWWKHKWNRGWMGDGKDGRWNVSFWEGYTAFLNLPLRVLQGDTRMGGNWCFFFSFFCSRKYEEDLLEPG